MGLKQQHTASDDSSDDSLHLCNFSQDVIHIKKPSNSVGHRSLLTYLQHDMRITQQFYAGASSMQVPCKCTLGVLFLCRGHASENPELPAVLDAVNVCFLGPGSEAMAALGDKVRSMPGESCMYTHPCPRARPHDSCAHGCHSRMYCYHVLCVLQSCVASDVWSLFT